MATATGFGRGILAGLVGGLLLANFHHVVDYGVTVSGMEYAAFDLPTSQIITNALAVTERALQLHSETDDSLQPIIATATATADVVGISASLAMSATYSSVLIPPRPDPSVRAFLTEDNIPLDEMMASPILSTCNPTSQVRIFMPNDEHHDDSTAGPKRWTMETLDEHGHRKTMGGDEFTIMYMANLDRTEKESPIPRSKYEIHTAVALAEDQHDGTYELEFVESPFGLERLKGNETNNITLVLEHGDGTLYVYMHHTCGMGRMTAPLKDNWRKGGGLLNSLFYHNVTTAPPMRKFHRPPFVNLGQFNSVICLGDSALRNMCGGSKRGITFYKFNIKLVDNVGHFLCNATQLESAFDKLDETFGKELNATTGSKNDSIAILVGSYAWDALANLEPPGHFFNRTLARNVRIVQRLREKYPRATVLWKGPHAVQLSMLDWRKCLLVKAECRNRVRYMSSSITQYVHELQKQIMAELNIPYLDVYETSAVSPTWGLDGDAVHYRKWFSMFQLDLFYPEDMRRKW